jgi:hypothetical protein
MHRLRLLNLSLHGHINHRDVIEPLHFACPMNCHIWAHFACILDYHISAHAHAKAQVLAPRTQHSLRPHDSTHTSILAYFHPSLARKCWFNIVECFRPIARWQSCRCWDNPAYPGMARSIPRAHDLCLRPFFKWYASSFHACMRYDLTEGMLQGWMLQWWALYWCELSKSSAPASTLWPSKLASQTNRHGSRWSYKLCSFTNPTVWPNPDIVDIGEIPHYSVRAPTLYKVCLVCLLQSVTDGS